MKAYIFPGQGAQYTGMGKELFTESQPARELFEQANAILGFRITDTMFTGTEDDLKQTSIAQPAIFLHSVVKALTAGTRFAPDMVAGHSLGEFSALVANGALSFSDALVLVSKRAEAMQEACNLQPGTMAAIIGLDDERVEEICAGIVGVVVPANYNCPGQLVISGSVEAVQEACDKLKATGAKRALMLSVGGAFHSPLMEPARQKLAAAIGDTHFKTPTCPIYQNVTAKAESDPEQIKVNLIAQLTAPVRWSQSVQNMIVDGAAEFIECGPGNVLQGLVKKISGSVNVSAL